ncbi:MAG TPA: hypothetical protein VF717_09305 [Pyrinomonadaceae bacterium]|jgi:hypothetical protein
MKKVSDTKRKSRVQSRAELARLLAKVMAHPELPFELYHAIGDEVITWIDNNAAEDPAYIETALNAYFRKVARNKKGGAR